MKCCRWRILVLLGLTLSVCGALPMSERPSVLPSPVVRVGVDEGESPCSFSGGIRRLKDGTLSFPPQPAADGWGWVTVGRDGRALHELEGLRSFTICGWLAPSSLQTGSGGNRIAFNLNYNRSGFDLVHLDDGRLRLSVNEWPDGVRNDSAPGKLKPAEWTFFAVTYDAAREKDNVCWYFGALGSAAKLDSKRSYPAGPTGSDSGPLTVGNYNQTMHRHGTDRQFRGYLHGIQIFGSQRGGGGALNEETIRQLQADAAIQPDFALKPEKARSTPPLHSTTQTDPAESGVSAPMPASGMRPRVIATTDGEIDDRCSMIRFLLYANEWDIEGIIHSSSKFHWKGDGQGVQPHNWADEVWLDRQIDLYEQIYPKLSQHASGFPTADALRKLIYTGNVANVGDMSHDTPGSDRIVEVLLDDKPGPVYLQAWGGTNTIARALWKIQHEHPDQMEKASRKAIIYIILDQDQTFREYIQPNWPDLLTLGSFGQFATIAYRWDRKIPEELHEYFDRAWMERNILRDHGPLCALCEAHPQKGFRSEGDSPAFMHQIEVGLRSLEHPGYGSWGGRFTRETPGSAVWKGARDGGDLGKPIWRFAEAFQNDWAARADWCVRDYEQANHPPQARVEGPLDRTARAKERVQLSAKPSTDPDGDTLRFTWWQYTDADACEAAVDISTRQNDCVASFVVPDEPGKTIHMILEVTDGGDPPLTRYQRIIVRITD